MRLLVNQRIGSYRNLGKRRRRATPIWRKIFSTRTFGPFIAGLIVFGAILVVLILFALFRKMMLYLPNGLPPPKFQKKNDTPPPPPPHDKKNVKVVVVEKLKQLFKKN